MIHRIPIYRGAWGSSKFLTKWRPFRLQILLSSKNWMN